MKEGQLPLFMALDRGQISPQPQLTQCFKIHKAGV